MQNIYIILYKKVWREKTNIFFDFDNYAAFICFDFFGYQSLLYTVISNFNLYVLSFYKKNKVS